MGAVYLARHSELGHEVALKLISNAGAGPDLVARFAREARAAARLAGHEGVVAVHDLGDSPSGPWMAMEYVRGRPLDSAIDEEGALPPREVAEIGVGIARAVAHAHAHGIIHRDLKPGNVILDTSGRPRVTDFGLATSHRLDDVSARLTQSGTVVGTPAYMPPEQIRDEPLDARADVYALGATLYEACCGHPPFGGGSMSSLLVRVLRDPLPPLRSAAPEVPVPLAGIIERCLARDRDGRYPSAEAVADDLERFLRGEAPVGARLASRPNPGLRTALAVTAGAILIAGVTWGAIALTRRGTAQVQDTHAAADVATQAQHQAEAYARLVQRTRQDLRRLEDHWRGNALAEPERAATFARIREAAAEVGADAGAPALAAAWTALAQVYATDSADHLHAMGSSAATGEPLADFVLAFAHLAWWSREVKLTGVLADRNRANAEYVIDTADTTPHRERAEALVAALPNHPQWALLTQRAPAEAFMRAIAALPEHQWLQAADEFWTAASDPILSGVSQHCGALFALLAGDPVNAGAAWQRCADRGWAHAVTNAILAYTLGVAAAQPGSDEANAMLQRGIAVADAELAKHPQARVILQQRAELQKEVAWHALQAGKNPLPDYRRAIEWAERMVATDPTDGEALGILGELHRQYAQACPMWGADGRTAATKALEVLEQARALPEVALVVHLQLALALKQVADFDGRKADANRTRLDRALAEVQIVLDAESREHHRRARDIRGSLLLDASRLTGDLNERERLLNAAITEFDAVLATQELGFQTWVSRSNAWADLGRLAVERGQDPTYAFDRAAADLHAVREKRPDHFPVAHNLALLLLDRARYEAGRNGDWETPIAEAIELANDLARSSPDSARPWFLAGVVWEGRGDLAKQRRDLSDLLHSWTEARAAYTKALERDPRDPSVLYQRGNLATELAALAEARGQDATPHWEAAMTDYTAAVAAQPQSARYRYNLAWAALQRAERSADDAQADEWYRLAVVHLDAAVEIEPTKFDAWHNRAAALVRLGRLEEALDSCDRALALDATSEPTRRMRESIREMLDR